MTTEKEAKELVLEMTDKLIEDAQDEGYINNSVDVVYRYISYEHFYEEADEYEANVTIVLSDNTRISEYNHGSIVVMFLVTDLKDVDSTEVAYTMAFRDTEGNEVTYERSIPVKDIDSFLKELKDFQIG